MTESLSEICTISDNLHYLVQFAICTIPGIALIQTVLTGDRGHLNFNEITEITRKWLRTLLYAWQSQICRLIKHLGVREFWAEKIASSLFYVHVGLSEFYFDLARSTLILSR